jgi:hypothetical protein
MSMPARIALLTVIWSAICGLTAIPSFILAREERFDPGGMVAGILLFVIAYVIIGCTDSFDRRFSQDLQFRRSIYAGYLLRALSGAIFPVGACLDMIPGIISVEIVGTLGIPRSDFFSALATTIVQGCFLNALLTVFMVFIYAIQKPFAKRQEQARGFAVLPMSAVPLDCKSL